MCELQTATQTTMLTRSLSKADHDVTSVGSQRVTVQRRYLGSLVWPNFNGSIIATRNDATILQLNN